MNFEEGGYSRLYFNPGNEKVTEPWSLKVIDPQKGGMFITLGDVNGNGHLDLVKASSKIRIFLRTNDKGAPVYRMIEVEKPVQPKSVKVSAKPKGVALLEMNGDPKVPEIVIVPEYEAQPWCLSMTFPRLAYTNDRVPCVYLENHCVVGLDPNDPLYIGRKPEGAKSTEYPNGRKNREAMTYYLNSHGHNNSVINGIGRIGFQ